VNVVDRITQIVARVSSRMFGGTTLSRNREWIQASIEFAHDGFVGAQALKRYPAWLKPLVARFVPAIRHIRRHYAAAERAALPLLAERAATGTIADDLLYWMSQDARGDESDGAFLAGILLKVSFAAIHTSAAAPTQLLYDLCARPEYVEPLRAEIAANTPEGARHSHILPRKTLQNLRKLDSIMKESQRFNPLLLGAYTRIALSPLVTWRLISIVAVTFERVVTKDYVLSDGLVIPANTTIGVPAHAISMDPDLHPRPETFDGFRFAEHSPKGQDEDRKSNKNDGQPACGDTTETATTRTHSVAYSAAHPASMAFGYGRHACPGRFFASAEIKAIMVYLLRNYDFKFPADRTERPPSLVFETQNLPNPDGRILFKRRRTLI
jgi:ent-kaurene oxidase